jgi:hypothetical protein
VADARNRHRVAITAIILLGIGGLFGVEWERREMEKYLRRRGNG